MVPLDQIECFARLLTEEAAIPEPRPQALRCLPAFTRMTWQALPSYSQRVLEWRAHEPAECEGVRARAEALRLFFDIQNRVLVEVTRHLRAIGLDHCLLKGTAHRFDLYRSPSDRGGIDLDIAIPEDASAAGRQAARDLGFVQSAWDEKRRTFVQATDEERAWIDENHYELGFIIRRHRIEYLSPEQESLVRRQLHVQPNPWHLMPDGGLAIWINLDLHTGLSHDIPVTEVIRTSREIEYRGTPLRVPARSWEIFHMVYKLYWEGVFSYGKGLYQYADICRLVPALTSDDWSEFVELLGRWRLEAGARYILGRLPSAFAIRIAGPLGDFLESSAVPREGTKPQQENNFGDVWSKLWGYR